MEYKSLYKLFFSDTEKYYLEYEKRFNNDHTVHIDLLINGNPAFFVLEPSLYDQAIDIYKVDKHIQALRNALPPIAIDHFTLRCLVDEIIISNGIEGVYSTRKEINNVLSELKVKSRGKRFSGFVQKYLMLKNNENLSFKSCEDIRNLYDGLLSDEIRSGDPNDLPDGKVFRKDQNYVLSASQKEIHQGVYPEDKIISYMSKSLDFLNDESIEPLFRIATFHYLFGYIHPFYDGNGRTSRFISSYLLSKEFESIIAFRLSYTIEKNITGYYKAFKLCNDKRNKGDITPFLFMFIGVINKSFHQLEEALQHRLEQMNYYHSRIQFLPFASDDKYYTLYSLLIQARLFSENGISAKELVDYTKLSRSTVMNRMRLLSDKNLLIKQRIGNSWHYSLNLDVVDEIQETK